MKLHALLGNYGRMDRPIIPVFFISYLKCVIPITPPPPVRQLVGWSVGLSFIITFKGGKLHFYALFGEL